MTTNFSSGYWVRWRRKALDLTQEELARRISCTLATIKKIKLLRRPQSRLLSLTGPGGVGKTRLALHVAAELMPSFPGGAWLVELAALSDPKLVVQQIASVLSVLEHSGSDFAEASL